MAGGPVRSTLRAGGMAPSASHRGGDRTPRGGPGPPPREVGRPTGTSLVLTREGALPGPLFRRLARAVRALGTERLRHTYQTAFWFDLGAPSCVVEEAVLSVAPRIPAVRAGRVAGVEWWLSRMRTSDVQVDFHQDRDEVRFGRTGLTRCPAQGSVLFLNRCRGGWLAVTSQATDDANPARAPLPFDGDLVRPWPNRLALFPGDAVHGVLDARGHVPHGRLFPPTPLRLALIMNWWTAPPEGRPTFAESGVYAALRDRRWFASGGTPTPACSPSPTPRPPPPPRGVPPPPTSR